MHRDGVRVLHAALAVAPLEQHLHRRLVQLPAARWQAPRPVAVQRADQAAHQRVGGQYAQFTVERDVAQQIVLVLRQPLVVLALVRTGRGVPGRDERGDLVAVHGSERQLGEALLGQPVRVHSRWTGGDEAEVAGVDAQEPPQLVADRDALGARCLVDSVDEQDGPLRCQHAYDPAVRSLVREWMAYGREEVVR